MSIFQSVKEFVTARQAAEQYGVKVNRNGMVCCPFHKDRHPKQINIYCTEFTSLCHCNLNEFKRKCYGDIEIVITDTTYEIRTETDNTSLLNHIACHG